MLIPIKPKEKFDKHSFRGLIYSIVSTFGLVYELLFSKQIRIVLIVGYSVIFIFGVLYIWFIKPYEQ